MWHGFSVAFSDDLDLKKFQKYGMVPISQFTVAMFVVNIMKSSTGRRSPLNFERRNHSMAYSDVWLYLGRTIHLMLTTSYLVTVIYVISVVFVPSYDDLPIQCVFCFLCSILATGMMFHQLCEKKRSFKSPSSRQVSSSRRTAWETTGSHRPTPVSVPRLSDTEKDPVLEDLENLETMHARIVIYVFYFLKLMFLQL